MLPHQLELSNLLVMGNTESICESQESNQHLSPIGEQRFLLVINVGSSISILSLHLWSYRISALIGNLNYWCYKGARRQLVLFAVCSCEEVILSISTILPRAELNCSTLWEWFHKFPFVLRGENNNLQFGLPEKCHLLLWFCSSMENVESFCFSFKFSQEQGKV